ncbi:MAG: tRNA pseudouridine(55) synthase TruB [Chloroflexota bacterium]
MTNGILNINKPKGMTSHDVVNRVRRITSIRRIGHAGTLDPMATGVLVLCVGRATRLSEYLSKADKNYCAVVKLGVETDTYDAEGEVISSSSTVIQREQVETALDRFRGTIAQVPPMYSAVKHKGQPLYRLARRGVTIKRKPRSTVVHHLEITSWDPPFFGLEVTCSSGTYVRSLAHDLGQQLQVGAHLTELVRVSSGQLSLEKAVTLEELVSGDWTRHLLPMEIAVAHLPCVKVDDIGAKRIRCGQRIERVRAHPKVDLVRACLEDGTFIGLLKPSEDREEWLPHKVLA